MPRGVIKKLNRLPGPLAKPDVRPPPPEDGYGVIEGDGHEVFFVASALTGARFAELKVGQPVDFEVEEGLLGRAARVFLVGETALSTR